MNSSDLFRKKSIAQLQADAASGFNEHGAAVGDEKTLRRTLGTFDLTMMGVAAIIGAGIFTMVGKASANGGPAVIFLFIFTAITCAFSALCYAEFASRIPVAGSAYTYAYASMGELIAWIIGWDLIAEYAIGNIAVAISWSDYFTGLLEGYGIKFPDFLASSITTSRRAFLAVQEALNNGSTIESLKSVCESVDAKISCSQLDSYSLYLNAPHIGGFPIILDLPTLFISLIVTTLVFVGIRESKLVSNGLTILKITVILLVIIVGAYFVSPINWANFAPNGFVGVMKGVSAVFFAYIGFDALSTTAEECKNPHRDLPRAMILSLVICTILYAVLSLVLTGMINYKKLDVADPLAFVFSAEGVNLPWVSAIVAVSAVVALATVFLVFQIGQPRLWMAMSRDGLLPKVFSSIHPRFQTPYFATIFTGLIVAIPSLFMDLTDVADLASIGTLFAFVLVCAGVLFKDKEFGRENRFVPYIDSRYIIPALFVIILGTLFYFYPDALKDLMKIEFDAAKGETWFGAFSHKIPLIVFFATSLFVLALCVTKRLSLIPVLGLLSCAYLMTELGITNWLRFGVWLIIGLVIYFLYGIKNSKLRLSTAND